MWYYRHPRGFYAGLVNQQLAGGGDDDNDEQVEPAAAAKTETYEGEEAAAPPSEVLSSLSSLPASLEKRLLEPGSLSERVAILAEKQLLHLFQQHGLVMHARPHTHMHARPHAHDAARATAATAALWAPVHEPFYMYVCSLAGVAL